MNRSRLALLLLALSALPPPASAAVNALLTTTTSLATNSSQLSIRLASTTGVNAPSANVPGSALYVVDPAQSIGEAMQVVAVVGQNVTVRRGMNGTIASAHAAGATVYVATNASWFYTIDPQGPCVAAQVVVSPWLNITTGTQWVCFNGTWTPNTSLGAAHIIPGDALPALCSPSTGDIFFLTTTGVPYFCNTTNTWVAFGSSVSTGVTSVATGCGTSGGPITSTGTVKASEAVNPQTGTTYVVLDGDCGKLVTFSNTAAIAVTLPQANGTTFVAGWYVDVQNIGSGAVTITPTTSTIDGAATVTLAGGQGMRIVSNATNYLTVRGAATSESVPFGASGSFGVVRTSTTSLSIGPACSTSAPCSFAFGTTLYTLTSATRTAVISAGSDTAYIYLTTGGTLTVGTNTQTVTCTGCTAVTGITAFPASALPLWTWTSTSGAWDTTGGRDSRTIVQKGADPLAKYLLQTADAQLPNSFDMGSLTTGLVKCTVSGATCTPSTAIAGTDYAVAGAGERNPGGTFVNGGSAIVAGATTYDTAPLACTIGAFIIWVDTGTASFDVWKIATGTALPTVTNTILSSYLAISSGTYLRSTTVTSFTGTSVTAHDIFGFKLQSVTGSPTVAHIELECGQ